MNMFCFFNLACGIDGAASVAESSGSSSAFSLSNQFAQTEYPRPGIERSRASVYQR
jgi:hypothetical protein